MKMSIERWVLRNYTVLFAYSRELLWLLRTPENREGTHSEKKTQTPKWNRPGKMAITRSSCAIPFVLFCFDLPENHGIRCPFHWNVNDERCYLFTRRLSKLHTQCGFRSYKLLMWIRIHWNTLAHNALFTINIALSLRNSQAIRTVDHTYKHKPIRNVYVYVYTNEHIFTSTHS